MPWRSEAMKDVGGCDKLRGGANQPLIRRCPNGETQRRCQVYLVPSVIPKGRRTRGTETSQYPEEKKSREIPSVAASERGGAQTRFFERRVGGCRVPRWDVKG